MIMMVDVRKLGAPYIYHGKALLWLTCTENLNLSKKRVLFDKLQLVMHMNFLIIQENKAENLFMLLDELFSAF